MRIWVDADSCPRTVRDTVSRAAARLGLQAVFVANRPIPGLKTGKAEFVICPAGDNSADDYIVTEASVGDLAVTRDVALAERLVKKGVSSLNDRGTLYTLDNIRQCLSLRNFQVGLAESGIGVERHRGFDRQALKRFADCFDSELSRLWRASRLNPPVPDKDPGSV